MLRLVICDDEQTYRSDLKKIIGTELELNGTDYCITEYDCGEDLAASADMETYQIIFLDIEMKRLDGIETAKKIRSRNKTAVILFVTSHSDFVFQGYEVRALNYLLKPYDKEKLIDVLHTAMDEIAIPREHYYLIETRSRSVRLPLNSVKYFFSDKRSITAVTTDDPHVFYGKLNDVESSLPEYFIRIHSRYLINLKYLNSLEGNTAVIDAELLPISRTFKHELSIAFAKYMLK